MTRFMQETVQHRDDVKRTMEQICVALIERASRHDLDKLHYDDLSEWLAYFRLGKHFSGYYGNTHHHKQDVEDILGVIEMLVDWVTASARRTKLLDPDTTILPTLNWDRILRNSLKLVCDLYRDSVPNALETFEQQLAEKEGTTYDHE